MPRTVLLFSLPAVLIAANWLRLEQPRRGTEWPALALLALVPALVRDRRLRVLAAVATALVAARIAFGVSIGNARPLDGRHDFIGPLASRFGNGFLDFYDVIVPFDPAAHELMHGVVLTAVFAFCLLLALAVAAEKPVAAAVVLLVGGGWPATLLPGGNELLRGALLLAGALVLLAGLSAHATLTARKVLPAAGALVLAAVVASTSPAVAKDEFLPWKQWDFYTRPSVPVSVQYVWDSNYSGIDFPKKRTTVLEIAAPPVSLYWRATTLDRFEGGRWVESLRFRFRGRDVEDPLLPARAADERRLIRQEVTVKALRDRHLVGASVPVRYRYDFATLGQARVARGGSVVVPNGLTRDTRYTAWSFAPRPGPRELARSGTAYPPEVELEGYLDVAPGVSVPRFGSPDREARMTELFATLFNADVGPYRALYDQALALAGGVRNPYAAALALETWFRTGGGFVYDEHPPLAAGVPPLVGFVAQTRRGYCQQYSGAMALMLRYLGVPARVAAGFTSGTYDAKTGVWTVTDHQAHTWVEVWFRGYGWLPFDPTPARGQLSAVYTGASRSPVDLSRLLELAGGLSQDAADLKLDNSFGERDARGAGGRDAVAGRGAAGGFATADRGASLIRLLALVALALAAGIAVAKLVRRRARYLTRDPRRIAGACRRELSEFLVDQRIPVEASATPHELGRIVSETLDVDAGRFVAALAAARFGPPDAARLAASRARSELRELLRQARAQLTRVERSRGLLSLRSLGFAS